MVLSKTYTAVMSLDVRAYITETINNNKLHLSVEKGMLNVFTIKKWYLKKHICST